MRGIYKTLTGMYVRQTTLRNMFVATMYYNMLLNMLHIHLPGQSYFSGDMSSSVNFNQETVDQRIRFIMDSQDPTIVDSTMKDRH